MARKEVSCRLYDGSLMFWRVSLDNLVVLAKRSCGRNLYFEESKSFFPDEMYRTTFREFRDESDQVKKAKQMLHVMNGISFKTKLQPN
jgi:hypothetical protein